MQSLASGQVATPRLRNFWASLTSWSVLGAGMGSLGTLHTGPSSPPSPSWTMQGRPEFLLCCYEPTINESVISDQGPGDDLHQDYCLAWTPALSSSTRWSKKWRQALWRRSPSLERWSCCRPLTNCSILGHNLSSNQQPCEFFVFQCQNVLILSFRLEVSLLRPQQDARPNRRQGEGRSWEIIFII